MKEGKPDAVQQARYHGDHEALKAMGRRGAEQAAINRELRRIAEERRREDLAAAMRAQGELYKTDEDGDVLPPDDLP